MIVLHASFIDGYLLLWGETPAPSSLDSSRRRRQKQRRNTAAFFPYGADVAALSAALMSPALSVNPRADSQETLFVWLPTVGGQPIASSPLIAEQPEADAHATLAPRMVTTLQLAPAEAVSLLCACINNETLAPGVIVREGSRLLGNGHALCWVARRPANNSSPLSAKLERRAPGVPQGRRSTVDIAPVCGSRSSLELMPHGWRNWPKPCLQCVGRSPVRRLPHPRPRP